MYMNRKVFLILEKTGYRSDIDYFYIKNFKSYTLQARKNILQLKAEDFKLTKRQVEGDFIRGCTYCSRRKTVGTERLPNPVVKPAF